MQEFEEEIISEAAELTKAVFHGDEEGFDEEYEGEQDDYLMVKDLRARIDGAYMDANTRMADFEQLPDFSDFEYDTDTVARVFYSIDPGKDYDNLSEISDLTNRQVKGLLRSFEDDGLVERSKGDIFYGENAIAYFKVLGDAQLSLGGFEDVEDDTDYFEELDEETVGIEDEAVAGDDEIEVEDTAEAEISDDEDESSQKGKDDRSLHEIMMDVAESDDDLETTHRRRTDV